MSNFPNVFDKNGLAVITGGASGFGYETSKRLLSNGMSVAILDVSEKELQTAKVTLTPIAEQNHAKVFGFKCNVTVMDDCVAAQKAIGLTGKWWGKRYVEIKQYIGLGDAYTPPDVNDMPEDCYTIYVGNLDFKVEEKDINDAFIGCGEIQEIRIATDSDGNKRGFAHITFAKQESVKQAILNLASGDYLLKNRPIKIDYDIPHTDLPYDGEGL